MKKFTLAAITFAALMLPFSGFAGDDSKSEKDSEGVLTLAVMGDWPYGSALFNSSQLLLDSVNKDPKVSLVLHVGDIHSGSQPCTGAGLSPVPAGSLPNYNHQVFGFFEQFKDPVVYTPGDNEWTDCHKTKQFNSGAPLNELAAVRNQFFSNPGVSLGINKKRVLSQAEHFNRAYPTDAQFVENVMWDDSQVMFMTVNMPGSNNDGLKWTAPFTDETARIRESAQRTLAAIRWMQTAFAKAEEMDAKAMLIGLQADMWDPAALVAGGDGLSNYATFVHELASLTRHFGRPVLLINGDSHVFGSDQPLANPASDTGKVYGTPAVTNLTRITVQGSTSAPAEWMRLTINPHTPTVFNWTNVPYCTNPAVSCP
jgi:hypothetical protein